MGTRQSVYFLFWSSHRPVFLVNSRQSHFSATPQCFDREGLHIEGHPFSRSYGVRLHSSLTAVLSSALGYSPHPPVSVLVRTLKRLPRGFSRRSVQLLRAKSARHHPWDYAHGFSCVPPSGFHAPCCRRASSSFRVPPSVVTPSNGTGILACHPSTTPFGLALGSD